MATASPGGEAQEHRREQHRPARALRRLAVDQQPPRARDVPARRPLDRARQPPVPRTGRLEAHEPPGERPRRLPAAAFLPRRHPHVHPCVFPARHRQRPERVLHERPLVADAPRRARHALGLHEPVLVGRQRLRRSPSAGPPPRPGWALCPGGRRATSRRSANAMASDSTPATASTAIVTVRSRRGGSGSARSSGSSSSLDSGPESSSGDGTDGSSRDTPLTS